MEQATPQNKIESETLADLLDAIEHEYEYGRDPPIRCDQCAEVINPGNDCSLLVSDRRVSDPASVSQFGVMRIECADCTLPMLYYDATGYTELIISGVFDTDYRLQDVGLIDISTNDEGLDWDPQTIQSYLGGPDVVSPVSPSGLMRVIQAHLDPSNVVDLETGEILIPEEDADVLQLAFAVSRMGSDRTKDELKAVEQSMEADVSLEDVEMYEDMLSKQVKEKLRSML